MHWEQNGKTANWHRINADSTFCCVILKESVDIKQRKGCFLLMHWERRNLFLVYQNIFVDLVLLFVFPEFFFICFSSVHCTCSKSICKGIRVCDFGNIRCDNENIYIWHYLCCQGFDELRAAWWCPLHLCKAGNKIYTEAGDEKPELDRQQLNHVSSFGKLVFNDLFWK